MWLPRLDGTGALYRQLYRAVRHAILIGELRPGSRLPSTRWLAEEAAVARNRVDLAYRQLIDEGYAVGRVGAGTFVARDLPEEGVSPVATMASQPAPFRPRLSRLAARRGATPTGLAPLPGPAPRFDFRYGRPSFEDFPRALWRRLHARCARVTAAADLDYAPPAGLAPLRAAIADHVGRWRGIACAPAQVVVVTGAQQALGLIAAVLLNPGDRVAMEEPHYPGARLAVLGVGAEIVPMTVDAQGLDIARLDRRARRLRLFYVTPSHQFPTGVIMPLARRVALLNYAARTGAYVVEDDYDSEYRYTGASIEPLRALDRNGRVIYVSSFSKILSPALRIGYVIVPPGLERAVIAAKSAADYGSSVFEQRLLAEFIRGGHLDVHLRRSRRRHAARRTVLCAAIERHLGDRVEIWGADSGLHVLLAVRGARPLAIGDIVTRARHRDVGVYPTGAFYIGKPRRAELLLGHGSLSEAEIEEGIERLSQVIGPRAE